MGPNHTRMATNVSHFTVGGHPLCSCPIPNKRGYLKAAGYPLCEARTSEQVAMLGPLLGQLPFPVALVHGPCPHGDACPDSVGRQAAWEEALAGRGGRKRTGGRPPQLNPRRRTSMPWHLGEEDSKDRPIPAHERLKPDRRLSHDGVMHFTLDGAPLCRAERPADLERIAKAGAPPCTGRTLEQRRRFAKVARQFPRRLALVCGPCPRCSTDVVTGITK